MSEKPEIMTVYHVEDQGDRVLLYGMSKTYHVIAKAGCTVRRGDTVKYEPFGMNFGWYIETVAQRIDRWPQPGDEE